MSALDSVSTQSLAGFGCESFALGPVQGFTDGDGPGNLFLGQRTGDGDLMRRRFRVMMIKSVYYHTNFMVYSRRQMNEN
jgi:hypothetical protein